jgi:adenylate cyclase
VTILFADIRNSTEIAERMDPMRLSVIMASFRRRVLQAAEETGGVVDKFIGDGALIVFGVPEPRPDDAARALLCARKLLHQIDRWNVKRRFDPPVRIGIGVHTGLVYCGLIGDDARLEFTVLGDAVNVAARIEDATKQFGMPLLASETVIAAAGELSRWQVISAEPLRGRTGAVKVLVPTAG